jgi:hypothetical protein
VDGEIIKQLSIWEQPLQGIRDLEAILPPLPTLEEYFSPYHQYQGNSSRCAVFSLSINKTAEGPKSFTGDIVFQEWDGNRSHMHTIKAIGPDGLGGEVISADPYAVLPIWTYEREDVLSIYPLDRENIDLLFGKIKFSKAGMYCGNNNFYGRIKWANQFEIITIRMDEQESTAFHPQIVLWQVHECAVSQIVYEEHAADRFADPDYSVDGNVVFTRIAGGKKKIFEFSPANGIVKLIGEGFGSSWSPDGTQFVFTGNDGLYISDGEGKSIQKAIDLTAYYPVEDGAIVWDAWPPMAVWSPDGRFLLYHRKDGGTYDLVKFQLSTKIETVIFQGGMYPDWK